jgi:hypothetical protein
MANTRGGGRRAGGGQPMTPLSLEARAVKDAVLALYSDKNVHKFGWQLDAPTVVAALYAAAHFLTHDRKQLAAIADELAEMEGLP